MGERGAAVAVRVGAVSSLLGRASAAAEPTELVVAPVELHRRNLQRRLREAHAPKDAFAFVDAPAVAKAVLDAAGERSRPIDRIDRLSLCRSALAADAVDVPRRLRGDAEGMPQVVEQVRGEVESVTNFHPARVEAFEATADGLYEPVDADARDVLDVALDAERALRERTPKAVSDTALVRRATRLLAATAGEAWTDAYPNIERVSLVGVSSVSAPQADLLGVLADETDAAVTVYARRGTGSYLEARLPSLLDVAEPGAEVFERR